MSTSIRFVQHDELIAGVPARLAHSGTGAGVAVIVLPDSHPPSCAPFAPSQLRDLIATMGALTPVHSGSSGLVHELRLFQRTGLPASRDCPSCPFLLQTPNTPRSPLSHPPPHLH